MTEFQYLHKNEIYPLPLKNGYLVYAPLSSMVMSLSADEVSRLENYLSGTVDDSEAAELLAYIVNERSNHRTIISKHSPGEIHKLTILPTHQCNFNCCYCYSAEGRENKSLSMETAKAMIDYFISRKRTSLSDLWLAILGGGEPFLTPQLTARVIDYACQKAKEEGFNLGIGLTTNGSIYNEELAQCMIANKVSLGVSFEILKDIQNQQRCQYDKVVSVVQRYMDKGVDITIKSIITPSNVHLISEMVNELHRLFPKVHKYKLQIVEDAVIFANLQEMKQFYIDFTNNFFHAEEIGKRLNIDVYVLASKYVDMLVEHYCGGEMCLTPDGTITICHRFSSVREKGYSQSVYGKVDDNGIVCINNERFRRLISHDINARKICKHCFVKWHCGGGCLAQYSIYNDEQLATICEWTKSFTKEILMRRLAAASGEDVM